jgi:hypothetical protein
MSATLLRIMESAQESISSPTVVDAANQLYSAFLSDELTDEQKQGALFNYTALVVSVAADKASIAVLGKDVVDSMSEEYEELIKMMEENND